MPSHYLATQMPIHYCGCFLPVSTSVKSLEESSIHSGFDCQMYSQVRNLAQIVLALSEFLLCSMFLNIFELFLIVY